jgi:radical SAM family uncharacterized protein
LRYNLDDIYLKTGGERMLRSPEQIREALARVLLEAQKPGRYVGGEYNAIVKSWESAALRVALAFPDIYDIGMPNLGLAIFYEILNHRADVLAERVYLPWGDMEAIMHREGIPLYTLETTHPVADFDLLAITLPYEQLYTNVLQLLHLAGLPILAAERDERWPLVLAGGHACYNPEPMVDFIDAFGIGEGEELVVDVVEMLMALKARGASRGAQLEALAEIPGIYVPRFYDVDYRVDGMVDRVVPNTELARMPVLKRIVPVLPSPPTHFVVPNIDVVHNRAPIEIMRGCTRGCRFCHAGMVTRPVRERPVAQILDAIEMAISSTGFEEIALLSLSSSDYTHILELVQRIGGRFSGRHLSISLPSLRIETSSADLMEALKDNKRGGFTFAPEAATEHMRSFINKPVPHRQVLEAARAVYERGWRTIKLYFMIGHPNETVEDVRAIADMAKSVLSEGRRIHGRRASVHLGVSTFIPKPHTPFQWASLGTAEQIIAKQDTLKREWRGPGLKLSWNDPQETLLEAFLSRGDRRQGSVIRRAWELGSYFDAWQEHHRPDAWLQALEESALTADFYARRPRSPDEVFPWDHIDTGVSKRYLREDYEMGMRGQTRPDCREQCYGCGILSRFRPLRVALPDEAWKCPPIRPE